MFNGSEFQTNGARHRKVRSHVGESVTSERKNEEIWFVNVSRDSKRCKAYTTSRYCILVQTVDCCLEAAALYQTTRLNFSFYPKRHDLA